MTTELPPENSHTAPRSPVPDRRLVINGRFLTQSVTGVQKVALNFLGELDRLLSEGHYPNLQVELVAPSSGNLVNFPQLEAVRFTRSGRFTGHLWEQIDLPRIAGKRDLLCLGNLAPLTRLATHSGPTHTMVHDLSPRYFPQAYSPSFRMLYRFLTPAVLSRSSTVFTVSESERSSILSHFPRIIQRNRLVAVQNGGGEGAAGTTISHDHAALSTGCSEVASRRIRSRSGLYVGSLSNRKNAPAVLRTAIELARNPGIDFRIVGAADSGYREMGIDVPHDVSHKIKFLGQVNDPVQIEAEYRRADFLLFPSFYEASPLPPIESMRWGCPVIAGDIPSLRERCGDAALFVSPDDQEAILRLARRLTGDDILWDRLQQAGLAWASQFSWRSQATTILKALAWTD